MSGIEMGLGIGFGSIIAVIALIKLFKKTLSIKHIHIKLDSTLTHCFCGFECMKVIPEKIKRQVSEEFKLSNADFTEMIKDFEGNTVTELKDYFKDKTEMR